ncbi:MAG: hypothetical protein LBH44_03545 [Treponema sp.]|jgi:hypothetical protein|nr:hypothetical protein [Treponema sp.]
MKKYSWIIALLIALSLAFFACDFGTEEDDDDGDGDEDDTSVLVLFADGEFFTVTEGESSLGGGIQKNKADLEEGKLLPSRSAIRLNERSSGKFGGEISLWKQVDISEAKFLVVKWGYDAADYMDHSAVFADFEFWLSNEEEAAVVGPPAIPKLDQYDYKIVESGELVEQVMVFALTDDIDNPGPPATYKANRKFSDVKKLKSIDFEIGGLTQVGDDLDVKRVYIFDMRLVDTRPEKGKPALKPKS